MRRFSQLNEWGFTWAIDEILPRKSTICPPLGLATFPVLCHDLFAATVLAPR
jgi:hypothetical protein